MIIIEQGKEVCGLGRIEIYPCFCTVCEQVQHSHISRGRNHEENSEKKVERENQPGQFSSHRVYLYVNLYISGVRKGITDSKLAVGYQ